MTSAFPHDGDAAGEPTDAFAIAIAAHDIAVLLRDAPERLLWRPGCPLWALALDPGSGPDYLALDGALAIAALVWPGHLRGRARYDLGAVAARLADTCALADPPPPPLFTLSMPHSRFGAGGVRLPRAALPFLARTAMAPAAPSPSWRCHPAPSEAAIAAPAHPWMSWTLSAPPAESADAFVDELDLPIDLVLLPAPWRMSEALARARARLRLERCRLGVAGMREPPWMADPTALGAAMARRLAAVADAVPPGAAAGSAAPAPGPPSPPPAAGELVSTFTQNQDGPPRDATVGPC